MTDTRTFRRARIFALAGAALLLAAAAATGPTLLRAWRYPDPGFDAASDLSTAEGKSAESRRLAQQFIDAGDGHTPRVAPGHVAYFTISWTTKRRVSNRCQIQLAIHTPSDWQLVDWTSKLRVSGGTINSWGTVQANNVSLREANAVVALETVDRGGATVAWNLPEAAAADTRVVRAWVVYACGDRDENAVVHPVRMLQ